MRKYNEAYSGENLNRIAFPLGGMGAGMICVEGSGTLSHFSLRHKPDVTNEPCLFSAISIKGAKNQARVLEGPVPSWKIFGLPQSAGGCTNTTYGLPRFPSAVFKARFPFAKIRLKDRTLPLQTDITAWSPFIPGDADNSSLPVAGVEYRFRNTSTKPIEAVYSFNSRNFIAVHNGKNQVRSIEGGFVLTEEGPADKKWEKGDFAAFILDEAAAANCAWFRGAWFDPLSLAWQDVEKGACFSKGPFTEGEPSPGGTIFVPFRLKPGEEKTIPLLLSWYIPQSDLRLGKDPQTPSACATPSCCCQETTINTYEPFHSAKFASIEEVASYWAKHYKELKGKSRQFGECFFSSSLPPEILEAVSANLGILKSPTVLRQKDGRLWGWEGCHDNSGCCEGTCTHVWNYAQSIPHLFPDLERTIRASEFNESQDERGRQNFRTALPIRKVEFAQAPAADGQLAGIMKVYRDWKISGDTQWLTAVWPDVRKSLDYCIQGWDPDHQGVLQRPQHNTYDIEFWGPNGMCTSIYLGALKAAALMGEALQMDVSFYAGLLNKGKAFIEKVLFNGEYFIQKITRNDEFLGEHAAEFRLFSFAYSTEAKALYEKEGPKYQYGKGCLSDGIIGAWFGAVCGLDDFIDQQKVRKHIHSVFKYNFVKDLSMHANPQRPGYALGKEGGLLLCTWPKGGRLTLPFVYSHEVWTGIEYQVASHLMMHGMVKEGLEIVRTCRARHDGRVRNPFDEYECGHWYARAMASYALLQGYAGIWYDAVERVLHIRPSVKGNVSCFLSTATGYGLAGVKGGKPFINVKFGSIPIDKMEYVPGGGQEKKRGKAL